MLQDKPPAAAEHGPATGLGRSSEGPHDSWNGSGGAEATAIFSSFDVPTPPCLESTAQ